MKRTVLKILSVLLALLLVAMLIPGILIAANFGGRGDPASKYLIVLGTTVNGTEPSPMLKQRLDAALSYLNTYPDTQCIVTGGMGSEENISEAQCMWDYLTAAGIDASRITMEDRATSTIENLRNTLAMLGETPEHVTILSSDFHLFRAGLMAKDLGLNASLVPAKTEPFTLLAPWFLREIFALYGYLLS